MAYGIWVLPAGTYGHGSCGARKGGGVKHPAGGGSLLVTTDPQDDLVPAAIAMSSHSLRGHAILALFCLPVLACLSFPTSYLLVLSKQDGGRQFLLGHGETAWPRDQGVPAWPPAPAPIASLHHPRHKIWDIFSHSPASWGLSHVGLKADFYKTFCNPKRVQVRERNRLGRSKT